MRLIEFDNKRLSTKAVVDLLQSECEETIYESTVQRWREKARSNRVKEIFDFAANFEDPVGIHFDGKSLIDIELPTKKGKRHERLAVLISGTLIFFKL